MEMIVLDTLGALQRHGHGLFGWCCHCGSSWRYWEDVKDRRTPGRALFDIDLSALIQQRGADSPVVGMELMHCPRCGSRNTEARITAPAKPTPGHIDA
jgi:hypothetical protein